MKASVIVTCYNQRRTLEFLLLSLKRQTEMDFEVIVADDGSSDGVESLCTESYPFPLHFVSQEDQGYRKAKILNKALRVAQDEYLIFLDADVVLEKHFIEDHLRLREPHSYVCGRRVDLSPSLTEQIKPETIEGSHLDRPWLPLIRDGLLGKVPTWKRGVRIQNPLVRSLLGYEKPLDILGSNLSLWKKDLEAINGFNEDLESYWGEDGDLFIRLRNAGKVSVGAKGLCIQYHLFHPRREPDPKNILSYQQKLKDQTYVWAKKGLQDSAVPGK